MIIPRVMPCLLLKDGQLVKTIKFSHPAYVGDPVNAVKIYNDKEVDELIFLDITATAENRRPDFEIIGQIASECFMPCAYGGGIREIEDIRKIFGLGIEKVAINSYAVENPGFIKEAASLFGSQSIMVSIDAKKNLFGKYEVYSRVAGKIPKIDPVKFAVKMAELGAGEILLNSVDRDGTMQGYDLDLVKQVSGAVDIPVIACGGAGKIEDFRDAIKIGGAWAVAIGSMAVFMDKNRAVLINFPSRGEIDKVLAEKI